MRADGDFRPDDVVNEEIFRRDIARLFNVIDVLEDRDRVVKMWRRLGPVCFQVAEVTSDDPRCRPQTSTVASSRLDLYLAYSAYAENPWKLARFE